MPKKTDRVFAEVKVTGRENFMTGQSRVKKMNIGHLFSIGKAAWNGFKLSNVVYRSSDHVKQFENRAIQKAVSTAYNETDFYREKYGEYGVYPRDIRTVDDLIKLPIITKKRFNQ